VPESVAELVRVARGQAGGTAGDTVKVTGKTEIPQGSVRLTLTAKVPKTVGVPDMMPLAESKLKPSGKTPLKTLKTIEPGGFACEVPVRV